MNYDGLITDLQKEIEVIAEKLSDLNEKMRPLREAITCLESEQKNLGQARDAAITAKSWRDAPKTGVPTE